MRNLFLKSDNWLRPRSCSRLSCKTNNLWLDLGSNQVATYIFKVALKVIIDSDLACAHVLAAKQVMVRPWGQFHKC